MTNKITQIPKGAKFHHAALQRGYIRKNHGYIGKYSGRFGTGFIQHLENCKLKDTPYNCSNDYHIIKYYIYTN